MSFPSTLLAFATLDSQARDRMRQAREAFFSRGGEIDDDLSDIRPEILHSWRRSMGSGVDPGDSALTVEDHLGRSSRLVRAAAPVMVRLGEQLEGSQAWGMLLDRDCIQLGRIAGDSSEIARSEARGALPGTVFRESMVGTNGAGTGVERLEPFVVVGPEHFRDSEQNLVSMGAPVRDALNRLVGVVSLNCRFDVANHLLVPFARDVAWAIRERLIEEAYGDERELFALFSQHSNRPSQPVIALSESVIVANLAARQLLVDGGRTEAIASRALEAVIDGVESEVIVVVDEREYSLRCRPVALRSGTFGVVASLTRVSGHGSGAALPASRAWDPLRRARVARDAGLSVIVRGEKSSGKTRLARELAHESLFEEFDARTVGLDPVGWMNRLRSATSLEGSTVLVRHIDELSDEVMDPVSSILGEGPAWCIATAGPVPMGETSRLDEIFPVVVECQSLRDRRGDFPVLVASVLGELRLGANPVKCAPEVVAVLARYPWRGNFAQLRRTLATAALNAHGKDITIEHLPAEVLAVSGSQSLSKVERGEREMLFDALKGVGWNREEAARELGISRATIYRKIKQFGIRVPTSRF